MKFTYDQPEEPKDPFVLQEKAISPESTELILSHVRAPEGSPAAENLEAYIEKLRRELPPKTAIIIEGKIIALSDLAKSPENRDFFIGYFPQGGSIMPRTLFLSRSNGVWRSMIGCTHDEQGEVEWHHKGYSEDSMLVPLALQKKMFDRLGAENMPATESSVMYGAIEVVADKKLQPKEYEKHIARTGKEILHIESDATFPLAPELLNIQKEKSPDFGSRLATWSYAHQHFGPVTCEVFPSADNTLHYMFVKTNEGKVWISGIEDSSSEITSLGMRKDWIDAKTLLTPPYEYASKRGFADNGYLNMADRRGPYADAYTNYVSKIPVVKAYQDRMQAE